MSYHGKVPANEGRSPNTNPPDRATHPRTENNTRRMSKTINSGNDTIFALSSGRGKSGVAVIRISGPHAREVISRICGSLPQPRKAGLKAFRNPATDEVIDRGLLLWFPGPGSFTGEDVAELHAHGGRAVISGLIDMLEDEPHLRAADPGEFTRRAFQSGKLDLTETEGLADLINAETEAQRKQALRQMGGGLSAIYEGWRHELIRAQALIEAEIDFSDEEDVSVAAIGQATAILKTLKSEIEHHIEAQRSGEIIRDGYRVVLAGPPNVGKSSLLNSLARRDAAITSSEAGTTRDAIQVFLDLQGWPVLITDTAGIRASEGVSDIEREGMSRSLKHAKDADLIIWVTEAGTSGGAENGPQELAGRNIVTIANKSDLVGKAGQATSADGPELPELPETPALYVSAKTGEGMDALISLITGSAESGMAQEEAPVITRARHRDHLNECARSIDLFLESPGRELELRAEDLRRAAHAIGRITGRIDVEDVLDDLFASFCIGK